MIKTVVCCDLCGITLPTEEVDSPFGKIEIVKTSKVEIWDVSNVFPHLCRGCALEIQYSRNTKRPWRASSVGRISIWNSRTNDTTPAFESDSEEARSRMAQATKCDKCEIRKAYAKAFDMHWLGEDDCPYVCEEGDDGGY